MPHQTHPHLFYDPNNFGDDEVPHYAGFFSNLQFLPPPLGPNILSAPSSQLTSAPSSSRQCADQVSHPYKFTVKAVVLYTFGQRTGRKKFKTAR